MIRKARKSLSKKLQVEVFRTDKWICRWCNRPVIFAPAMRLLEREMRRSGRTEPLAYYHPHATRDGSPLLDELWAVIDHVVPHSIGGSDDKDNLVTACNKCNARKNSAPADKWNKRHIRKPVKGKYGEPQYWDGLSGVFVMLAQRDPVDLSVAEKAWLKVLAKDD